MNDDDLKNTIYFGILAVVAVSSILIRGNIKTNLKMVVAWAAILLLVTAMVIYWPDIKNSKFYTGLVPGSAKTNADGTMTFLRAADGHFHIDANVNGRAVRFMVDTGASDIVLTKADAAMVGLEVNELAYTRLIGTANGKTRAASVTLNVLQIGGYRLHDVSASVNEGELDTSLLGMSFLDRLRAYRIEGDELIISY